MIAPLAIWLALAEPDGGTPDALAPPPVAETAPAAVPAVDRAGARTLHAQGMARLRAGDLRAAADLFAKAVERDPNNAGIATDWGFALGRLGERAQAEAILRGAIEKDPRRSYAYANLADLLAQDPSRWERRDAEIALLEKGLETLKDDRKARFTLLLGLAGFERAVGRTAAARARLQPLLAADAAPLTRAQRKRVLDLLDGITLDERAQALEDWPAPRLTDADAARAQTAAALIARNHADEALPLLDALLAHAPSAAALRVERARALEAAGRVDEAARDLEIAVNLAPSNADAWRALGRLLAAHGGALELDRADEALRQALTLEPAWSDLRELRAQIARRRAVSNPPPPRGVVPSEHARALYQQAEEWTDVGDPIGMGRDLVEEALADSPGFVAAAVSLYALGGAVPPATIDALHDDGPGLWALASGVRKLGKSDTDALVRPWIDRAVELDVQEARFARAVARAAAGDRAGALDDLVAYIGREPNPEHLAEARALRAGLGDATPTTGRHASAGDTRLSPQLLARIRLLEDRPEAARQALGGTCVASLPAPNLLELGMVDEYVDRRTAARQCYELAASGGGRAALDRLARLDARLPDAELREANRRLIDRAAAQGSAAAVWSRARLERAAGDDAAALADTRRALGAGDAAAADVWVPAARAAERELSETSRASETLRSARRRQATAGATALVTLALLLFGRRRWHGRTVAAALRRRPALFPEVARAVGELRHDVLKHRAGVLGAANDPQVPPEAIARALTEPRPTSEVVATIYDQIAQAARGAGTPLRPLAREPVFGALARDLARAELLATRGVAGARVELAEIDHRLRGPQADALDELLRLGPRTRLDAAALAGWIAAVEAEARRDGRGWTAPGLSLADLDLDFPVELGALSAVFANLLRNAAAAVEGRPDGRLLVRADRERDVTGRQWVRLVVADSAPDVLTLEAIEARESGRGLAIVRDLVRAWRGHLVVRPEPAPYVKLVGASFPL